MRVVLAFIIVVSGVCEVVYSVQNRERSGDSGSLVNALREQNSHLERQNRRLQQVWTGMEHMCRALGMGEDTTCACDGGNMTKDNTGSSNTNSTWASNATTTVSPRAHISEVPERMRIVSVTSSGTLNDVVDVAVTYEANATHTTDWLVNRKDIFGSLRTLGNVAAHLGNKSEYSTNIAIRDIQNVSSIIFRLHGFNIDLLVQLNPDELTTERTQVVNTTYGNDFAKIDKPVYVAHRDTPIKVTVTLAASPDYVADILDDIVVWISAVNSSTDPPSAFELIHFQHGNITFSNDTSKASNGETTVTIIFSADATQYGGNMLVRVPTMRRQFDGMIQEMTLGLSVEILPPVGSGTTPGTLGVYSNIKQVFIFDYSQSMICFANANPPPTMSILRKSRRGELTAIKAETIIQKQKTTLIAHTFQPEYKSSAEGDYICRATAGNQTIDSPVQVIAAERPRFDDAKTGVIRNTTRKVVIACKASGIPRPKLGILLYDQYGPDLVRAGLFKISEKSPDRYTTRVTMTIPPGSKIPRDKLHTLVCFAGQGHRFQYVITHREIHLYPGVDEADLNKDMDLYYRLKNDEVPLETFMFD